MAAARPPPPPDPHPATPWQLRIELLNVSLAVWRRLLVPSEIAEPDPDGVSELPQRDERRVLLSAALGGEARTFGTTRHEEYIAWSGGGFDPARFDRETVNRVLRKVKG